MTKLFRFLVPLCVFLLSGYIPDSGYSSLENIGQVSPGYSEKAGFASYTAVQNCEDLIVRSTPSDQGGDNGSKHATGIEEKEDELISLKKCLEFSNDFTIPFLTETPGYLCFAATKSSSFFKHFSYSRSYRFLYLILEVFRI